MKRRQLLAVSCWLVTATALACKVPVFRFALERWPVDNYRWVVILDGAPDESLKPELARLESLQESSTNLDVEIVDLATLSEQEFWQLEGYDGSTDTPRLQVFYPEKDGKRIKCWDGPLRSGIVTDWLDSPLRRQVGEDLISGQSGVFLLVDGLDSEQNQELEQRIKRALAAAAAEIKIPDGVIKRSEANDYLQEHPDASMDDVLRSDIPLQVAFQLRRLARDDPDEMALLAMIHSLVEDPDQPVLVPIFGRGRMLDALNASECSDEMIMNACRYLVGECSCTVKALNPGVDLLLTVNWSDQLGQSVVMVDAISSGPPQLIAIPSGEKPADGALVASNTHRPMGVVVSAVVLIICTGVIFGLMRLLNRHAVESKG